VGGGRGGSFLPVNKENSRVNDDLDRVHTGVSLLVVSSIHFVGPVEGGTEEGEMKEGEIKRGKKEVGERAKIKGES